MSIDVGPPWLVSVRTDFSLSQPAMLAFMLVLVTESHDRFNFLGADSRVASKVMTARYKIDTLYDSSETQWARSAYIEYTKHCNAMRCKTGKGRAFTAVTQQRQKARGERHTRTCRCSNGQKLAAFPVCRDLALHAVCCKVVSNNVMQQ